LQNRSVGIGRDFPVEKLADVELVYFEQKKLEGRIPFGLRGASVFGILEYMFPAEFDLDAQPADFAEWDTEAALNWRPPDERDAVYEAFHRAERARLDLMNTLVWWDRADAHTIDGARSAAGWLRAKLRISHGHSVGLLRQARGLRDCPALHHALLSGTLTFDQVDQLLAVFTAARASYTERDVDWLVDRCNDLTVAHCRTLARSWAARVDAEIAAAIVDAGGEVPQPPATVSELRMGEILDGDMVIEATLNASDAAVLSAALTAAHKLGVKEPSGDNEALEDGAVAKEDDAPKDTRSPSQQRADALVLVAQFFLDHHDNVAKGNGGSINRAHVNITVDLDRLTSAHLTGNAETPYSLDGVDIWSVVQACCDSSVARILTAGPSIVIDLGRETRVVSPALRKAVCKRDRTCRFPGCNMPAAFTDVHHVWHWIRGGPTNRENCCLLCRRHHTMIHKGGWTATGNANGTISFVGPEGLQHLSRPPNLQLPLAV
jgi:Domain of unknown function (DUF222)/HNH endonuclease